MQQPFRRYVTRDDYLSSDEQLAAYSRDASPISGRPRVVLRPKNREELRRIIIHAGSNRSALIPRGTGTGVRGGAVLRDGVILHLHHFNKVRRLDTQLQKVDVEAGVSVGRLNEALEKHGLVFPLVPENRLTSLGGLAAVNAVMMESHRYGQMLDLIESVEAFDGVGRLQTLKGERVGEVVGGEGSTGIITQLRLQLTELTPPQSYEIAPVEKKEEVERLLARFSDALCVEYLDPHCARCVGLPAHPHIVALFQNLRGSYQNPVRVEAMVRKLRAVGDSLHLPEDFTVDEQSVHKFLALCSERQVPVHGHIGIGVLVAHPTERSFKAAAMAVGARLGGKYGYGRWNREFVPFTYKSEIVRIKEKRDYKGILNPGLF